MRRITGMMQNLRANKTEISPFKNAVAELAVFGGKPVFSKIRSTSNLFKPNPDDFFKYAKVAFEKRWLSNNGELVQQLEKRLSELHQVKHCITVCNGLWALIMTLKCIAIPGRTEVIMPSLTYRRMADITAWLNLTPHFSDVDGKTLGMTPEVIKPIINENTAAIIAAHPMVNLSDIDGILKLAQEKNIPVMFDSVEAAYASHNGKMIGSFGSAEIYSMHASKFLNGFEAGYITTNDDVLADKLKLMRGFGFRGPDNVEMLGLNAKLNELHAAMTLASLDGLEGQVEKNKQRYFKYKQELQNIKGIELVEYNEKEKRSFKTILIKISDEFGISRDDLIKLMHKENMLVRPYYSPPLHAKKTQYKTITGDVKNTDVLKTNHMLMPCGEFVSESDIEEIAEFLRFIQKNAQEIKGKL